MKAKKWKALTLLFTVLFTCQSIMLPTISAEESTQTSAASSTVLGEAQGLRGQFEKHLVNDDGTMTAIVYSSAVHYEKDGEWVDYDNTLVPTARDGQVVYQNSSNPLQVCLLYTSQNPLGHVARDHAGQIQPAEQLLLVGLFAHYRQEHLSVSDLPAKQANGMGLGLAGIS